MRPSIRLSNTREYLSDNGWNHAPPGDRALHRDRRPLLRAAARRHLPAGPHEP